MKIIDHIMMWLMVISLVLRAVVLIMFVFDPNVNAEYIHQMEMENDRW